MNQTEPQPYTVPVSRWLHTSRRWSIRGDGPTTVCYADICRFAVSCPSKTSHPRGMPQSRCPRYWPEEQRPLAGLSRLLQGMVEQYSVMRANNGRRPLHHP
ncbi:MAG: hypothetical protein Q7K03_09900 [Dehalococcoidia bacterium]|nr:hypothetical protein [Dehalococcoidia bacterium]